MKQRTAADIIRKHSPNMTKRRNGHKPIMIVNHITEGLAMGSISWLCNPTSKASSHYVVTRQGRIYQLVDIQDAAWCNGTQSKDAKKKYYYKRSTNPIVQAKVINANMFTVSIEHEGFSYKEGFGALTEEQYQATLWLHKYIIDTIKRLYGYDIRIDREHIVGHYEIAPKEKPNCPGSKFPWQRLISDLKSMEGQKMNLVKIDYNGKKIEVEGKLVDNKNYISARDLFEKLGHKVDWNSATKEIIVR